MELRKAERKQAKIKMALQGPSGSGKTYSSLLLAYGLCNDWSKIAVIDTENNSADLYAHLGNYHVLQMSAPFNPEKYIEAIEMCEDGGIAVIIIDSISHEWDSTGGILDIHNAMLGNSFTNWAKVTPRHNSFTQKILQSKLHIIATVRTKQDYVLSEKNGKMVPEKVGLKAVTRDGMDYEFTIVFDIAINNMASASKDRTGLFYGKPELKITSQTGKRILDWCNTGTTQQEVIGRIRETKSLEELVGIYNSHPEYQQTLKEQFINRKNAFSNHQHT